MAAAASAFRASQWDTKWEVLLHYVEALLCCMDGCIVCMYGQKMRHKASWLKPVCLTHCSSTTPTKWRQQKKKKKKKYLFFFYAGLHREDAQPIAAAPVTISPPFGRRNGEEEKKSVPRMNRTKHFVFSSFFFGCVSLSKNQWRLNNKAQTLQCHTCALARGNVASLTPVS